MSMSEKKLIKLTLNGKYVEMEIDIRQSLLEAIRGYGLVGAKEGCSVGECGACTVLLDGTPIDSCIALALWADGKEVTTIEGLSKGGEISPVQQAFIDTGAAQCGFCTPGLVVKTTEIVEKFKDNPEALTREVLRAELAGNLCRCTGYQAIIDAGEKAAVYYNAAEK